MRIFNKLMNYFVEYIDLINCCIIWLAFALIKISGFSINFSVIFLYILYFEWIPFIYGFMRMRYFKQKSIKNILLFTLNLITFPVYSMVLMAYIVS